MPLVLKDFITLTAEKKSAIFRPIQWLGTLTGDSMLELAQSEKAHREKAHEAQLEKPTRKCTSLPVILGQRRAKPMNHFC